MSVDTLKSKEKAAILLISLGLEYSAEMYQFMTPEEISEMTVAISKVQRFDRDTRDQVVEEFHNICIAQQYIMEGGLDYARDILRRVVGDEGAENLIKQLNSTLQSRPFDYLRKAAPSQVLNAIHNELPQTIAFILSQMVPSQAAEVVSALDPEMQADVIAKIATMGATSPEFVQRVQDVLERKITSVGFKEQTVGGGVETIVEIINSLGHSAGKSILAILESSNAQLADEIRAKQFVFDDIAQLSNQYVQRIIKEVPNNEIAVALKMVNEDVRAIFFNNMSKRQATLIKDDMDVTGPLRVRDVEDAQQRIIAVIRKLEEDGEIIISRGGEDEMVV